MRWVFPGRRGNSGHQSCKPQRVSHGKWGIKQNLQGKNKCTQKYYETENIPVCFHSQNTLVKCYNLFSFLSSGQNISTLIHCILFILLASAEFPSLLSCTLLKSQLLTGR
ncbi:hypothetical protein AB205_0205470 [Aquarana catesbeiana]|uniref:Uncharacterized protein n=1 Tax=Aquarana catesbeiana TaxID=8400 RepID=A0A2G9RS64_AQUCT|nr:hypothetical protein AB205_0205470 [Aquarana catesbeiana]